MPIVYAGDLQDFIMESSPEQDACTDTESEVVGQCSGEQADRHADTRDGGGSESNAAQLVERHFLPVLRFGDAKPGIDKPEYEDFDTAFDTVHRFPFSAGGHCSVVEHRETKELYVTKSIEACRDRNHQWRRGNLEKKILTSYFKPHPLIVRVFVADVRLVGSRPHSRITMEYCSGGDLDKVLCRFRHNSVDVPEVLMQHAFVQLIEALAYCHHGIRLSPDGVRTYESHPETWIAVLHRDIKPSNVFIRWSCGYRANSLPDFVLGDFGVGCLEGTRAAQRYTGTPGHFSPEVKALIEDGRNPPMTAKSDIWAVGSLVHDMALACTAEEKVLPLNSKPTSANMHSVVQSCLQHEPSQRPSAEQLLTDGWPHVRAGRDSRLISDGEELTEFSWAWGME
ncbi:hypothetical protein LTR66_008865 [Elasticomyces elasticus]|nr:hypothetical protein LTR66_008865 [Elasticomyces elasticus]KAK5009225.1 hypothetical protein LTR28_002063 [Elasticomyces elasticus]